MNKARTALQTKKAKEEYQSELIDFLKEARTKQEIMAFLNCGERETRDQVAECAMHYPVITYSVKGVGYRRAKSIDSLAPEDLEIEMNELNKALADYKSRVKQLKRRMKPMIAWLKVAAKKLAQFKGEQA